MQQPSSSSSDQPSSSSPSSQPSKLPKSLQKLKVRKQKQERKIKLAVYLYCLIGAVSQVCAFVFSLKHNTESFFKNPALILLYMVIMLFSFSLLSFLCFFGLKEFRNAFSILRLKLLFSYLICAVTLIGKQLIDRTDLAVRLTDPSLRYLIVVLIPHLLVFVSATLLNILICRSHKGTIFKQNPEADVDKLEFGSQIMKEIGKYRGDSILKNVKHAKLAEETESNSCNKQERAFELAKCQHMFHHSCLKEWIKRMNTSCPICRDQVFQQK